jgi:hypothetical protein
MRWFVNRGDDMSDSVPESYSFYRNISVGSKLKIEEEVSSCANVLRVLSMKKANKLTNGWSKKMLYSLDENAPEYFSVDSEFCLLLASPLQHLDSKPPSPNNTE